MFIYIPTMVSSDGGTLHLPFFRATHPFTCVHERLMSLVI